MHVGSVYPAPLPSLQDPRAVRTVLLDRSKACPDKCDAISVPKALSDQRLNRAAKRTANHALRELLPLSLVRQDVLSVLPVLSANRAQLRAASVQQDLTVLSWG